MRYRNFRYVSNELTVLPEKRFARMMPVRNVYSVLTGRGRQEVEAP